MKPDDYTGTSCSNGTGCGTKKYHGRPSLPVAGYAENADLYPPVRGSLLTNQSGGKAYADDSPVYQSPLTQGCNDVDSCHRPEKPKCSPFKSFKKLVKEAMPDWVRFVQPKSWNIFNSKLLVTDGRHVGTLRSRCKGPVYVDGDRVVVEHPELLTHQDSEEAVIENGLIPLAIKSREICEDDNGDLIEREVIQHGYQQLRDTGFGEFLGIRRDCATGAVRQDVIQPTPFDQVEGGLLEGFQNLGYVEEEHDLGDCCVQKVKRWYTKSGAVFGPTEVIEDNTNSSLEASLIPRDLDGCDRSYQLAFRPIVDKELLTDQEQDDYRLVLAQVSEDPDCPGAIAGHTKQFFPIPDLLVGDNYESLLECIQAQAESIIKLQNRIVNLEAVQDPAINPAANNMVPDPICDNSIFGLINE